MNVVVTDPVFVVDCVAASVLDTDTVFDDVVVDAFARVGETDAETELEVEKEYVLEGELEKVLK